MFAFTVQKTHDTIWLTYYTKYLQNKYNSLLYMSFSLDPILTLINSYKFKF